MNRKSIKKILHILTNEIAILDIPRVLDELGYDVYTANLDISSVGFCEEDSKKIVAVLEEHEVDCVTSYDFSESISHACMSYGIPYISWVYDNPQKELYTHYALYPCNYIFVFDKIQLKRMKDIGIQNVYFMPLAIHGEKIKHELKMQKKQYNCDVAFVGQLYRAENTERVVALSPSWVKEEVERCIDKCFMQWNDNAKMHGSISEHCAAYFDSLEKVPIENKYPLIKKEFYYEAAVMSRMIAHRERVRILNGLAEKYDVRLYTFDRNTQILSDKVQVRQGIKHDAGISCVYRDAKINLNITLHCIESGACQRVFDVMASGGFMLSNYQKELEELFEVGKEIVLYHNEEELLSLVEYYLTHEKEREEIARNGQRKVLAYHNLSSRFQHIMKIVSEQESERNKRYVDVQREMLTERTNNVLASASINDIRELIELYHDPVYDLATMDETDLGLIKEMLFVWEQEQSIKNGNIFANIENVKEAVLRYLRTKHVLLRIENDCNYEACLSGVRELLEQNISGVFMAWLIKSKLQERKEVYLKLSEYLWNISPSRGIEMLSYGLFDFPEDTDMLLYKADYLLELQYYSEALKTLKCIREPNDEINELIQELESALAMS